ncbi:MAG: Mut7-C RNAse domain-containing protein [Candidatus Caldarchaeales archaeon]
MSPEGRRSGERPKFIADSMHGKLARWLRLLGYDSVYARSDDDRLLLEAEGSGRVLVTSDVELHRLAVKRGVRSVLVPLEDVERQLAAIAEEVSREFGLDIEEFFEPEATRCSLCNGELIEEGDGRHYVCASCGQRYWEGSHWPRIERTLESARRLALKRSRDASRTRASETG